jgi:hypothetical protein
MMRATGVTAASRTALARACDGPIYTFSAVLCAPGVQRPPLDAATGARPIPATDPEDCAEGEPLKLERSESRRTTRLVCGGGGGQPARPAAKPAAAAATVRTPAGPPHSARAARRCGRRGAHARSPSAPGQGCSAQR